MKSKGVQTRLVKPTETTDLNIGELLLPRLIAGIIIKEKEKKLGVLVHAFIPELRRQR